MSTETAARLMTAEEFYELPEAPHGGKMELICGRVVTHMPVGEPHGEIAGDVYTHLRQYIKTHNLGAVGLETGFRLSQNPDIVRSPGVHFVRADRVPGGRMPHGYFPGPPDLAVEVVSPGDTDREIAEKLQQYQAAGVIRSWVVRPEQRTITVHHPDSTSRTFHDGETLTSHDAGFKVDGFELSISELFGETAAG